jgi:hypothetical protein
MSADERLLRNLRATLAAIVLAGTAAYVVLGYLAS